MLVEKYTYTRTIVTKGGNSETLACTFTLKVGEDLADAIAECQYDAYEALGEVDADEQAAMEEAKKGA